MASLRALVSAADPDVIQGRNIRIVERPSVVNLFGTAVTVTDTIGLKLGKVDIMEQSTLNVSAAALGLVRPNQDQLVFDSIVFPGAGDLQLPVNTLTTSLIFLLSVEPLP